MVHDSNTSPQQCASLERELSTVKTAFSVVRQLSASLAGSLPAAIDWAQIIPSLGELLALHGVVVIKFSWQKERNETFGEVISSWTSLERFKPLPQGGRYLTGAADLSPEMRALITEQRKVAGPNTIFPPIVSDHLDRLGIRHSVMLPLKVLDGVVWVMGVHSADEKWSLAPWEHSLLDNVTQMLAMAIDVCEYQRTVTTQQEHLSFALEAAQISTWQWDVKSGAVHYSDEGFRIMGYEPGELPLHISSWENNIHPDDRARVLHDVAAHLSGETAHFRHEYRLRMKSGEYKWILARGRISSRDDDGSPRLFAGVHIDISRQRARVHEEQNRRAFLQAVIDSYPDSFLIIGPDFKIQYANKEIGKFTDVPVVPNVTTCGDLFNPGSGVCDDPTHLCSVREAITTRKPHVDVRKYTELSGREVVLEVVTGPVFDDEGEVACVLQYARDISEHIREQERRVAFEKRVQHAQKLESLGLMAGGVAHDFNNILAAIRGNAELALHALQAGEQPVNFIKDVLLATGTATDLTQQMLAYSGKGLVVQKTMNCSEVITEIGAFLVASLPKSVTVEQRLTMELPSIDGDVAQIKQVIVNLILNAAEAYEPHDDGAVIVETGVRDFAQIDMAHVVAPLSDPDYLPASGSAYVYISVRDHGVGMDSDTVAKVFDPFFTTKFTGRGLGMAAVLGIVKGHKGLLTLETAPGRGSCFTVYLPVGIDAGKPLPDESRLKSCEFVAIHPGCVLLVDDEEVVRVSTTRLLKHLSFQVLQASSGKEAVELLREQEDRVCIAIVDLSMRDLDGVATMHALREVRPELPVVISSGFNRSELTERVAFDERTLFLQKPYGILELRNIVKRLR